MAESVELFSKNAVLNLLAILVCKCMSQLRCAISRLYFIQIGHLGLHLLCNHFGDCIEPDMNVINGYWESLFLYSVLFLLRYYREENVDIITVDFCGTSLYPKQ